MPKKCIHYCWFGDKPFPKLGKKCLESWKKYLPDYEIIKWSEDNVDLNECPFIKMAYEQKAWAFVADYTRTKALNEMGGIYFDTDMEVTKDISEILEKGSFLGVEDTGKVNSAVWYEEKPHGYLSTELLKRYRSFKSFNRNEASDVAIPILITEILDKLGFEEGVSYTQKLPHDIYVYPREYFYPYSYGRDDNIFTDNTCMIHYYDASWIPFKERLENQMVRKLGKSKTFKILKTYRIIKDKIRKIGKIILFPVVFYKKHQRKKSLITDGYLNNIENSIKAIENYQNKEYIAIHNGGWLGVTSATKELFEYTVDIRELYRNKDIKRIGDTIITNNINQVIFSAMSIGDYQLIKYLKKKNPNIKIKIYWHGSHSQVLDSYGWERNLEIIKLHKKHKVDVIASCKESLYKFYKNQGYNAVFLTNKVETNIKPAKKENNQEIRIGLYAAKCDDWRKNMYTQMAAVSLIDNAVLDMVPLNESAKEFAKLIGLRIEGEEKSLSRDELIKRMSKNDVNLYVTFSECAPMLPLESFEMNVPCITGNNHHYFKNNDLEKLLVVKNEDNPVEIKEKVLNCIKNKSEILNLYKAFNDKNLKESQKQIKAFIEM